MQAFLEPLKELADYQEIVSSRRKKTGFLQIAGCVNSQKIHLAKALSDGFESVSYTHLDVYKRQGAR